MRRINDLVIERRRQGRRRPERTCTCDAVAFPHRLGSVKGCYGDLICSHGWPTHGHPDFDEACPECAWEAYSDLLFDQWHDEHGL